nr:NADH dehydrogenase subunit 6 [Macrodiprion sp. 2 GYN-2022c]
MYMKTLILFLSINTTLMFMMKTPFSMGLILLIQTFLISITSGMLSLSFWYSYMIFLILLGSLLIIFIYVSSLISNMKFMINKLMLFKLIIVMLLFFFMIMSAKMNFSFEDSLKFSNSEMNKSLLMMSLNKLYNKPTFIITFMMMNYLFITLIIVVKISNVNLGSLRKTF